MKDLLDAFRHQSVSCANLGSPFMGRLFALLADNWPGDSALACKCATFQGDLGPAGASLPLRIASGLHALVLQGNDLAQAYPPQTVSDADLLGRVLDVIDDKSEFLCDWIDSPPQANEIRRSAVLIAGAHVALQHFDLPIRLSELGASGGLNLMWDRFALVANGHRFGPDTAPVTFRPDWTGPVPPKATPNVVERCGVDLRPLDPTKEKDLLRLTAYLWPDQPDRLEMTRAAAGCASSLVEQGDAIDWLDRRLNAEHQGQLHMIQNTVAWQYFPSEAQARGLALIRAAGERATPSMPLAWLSLETDGDINGLGGAAITLKLWPGDLSIMLGRADFHGRWIRWTGLGSGKT